MQLRNLYQLLYVTANNGSDNGLYFYKPGQTSGDPSFLSYSDLLKQAEERASNLYKLGVRPGKIILLHFSTLFDNFIWFWAATYAGLVPALSPPFKADKDQRKDYLEYLDSLLDQPVFLTSEGLRSEFLGLKALNLQTVESLPASNVKVNGYVHDAGLHFPIEQGKFRSGHDTAAIMLTSGSTGNSKAVLLTHHMILTSLAGKWHTHQTDEDGPFFNWIGADHVACLTEMHLHALWVGASQIHAQAADVVPNPLFFTDIIEKHRVARAFAPNFFLAGLKRALEDRDLELDNKPLDLQCLKSIVTGGEANVVETCTELSNILTRFGAAKNVLSPAFGMTETCGGSIYSKEFPDLDAGQDRQFASVGRCVPGMEMRITDENGAKVSFDTVGALEVKGPLVFSQYHNNPNATAESFNGDWFITGDQGTIDSQGNLHLTGRKKETIIINGINYLPQDIETALEGTTGAKPSYTAAFPIRPKGSDTESLCIVYLPDYDPRDPRARTETNDALTKAAVLQCGIRPVVLPLDETVLEKSTLGKLSRPKLKKAFESGVFESFRTLNDEATSSYKALSYKAPKGEKEKTLANIFREVLDIRDEYLSTDSNILSIGVSSIDIIKIKQRLQDAFNVDIPIVTVMSNPTISGLAYALDALQTKREYNPIVTLQSEGSKTPLWLIHPGVGEVLVFLPLASHITDRPVHAIRARGFEENEPHFGSWNEAVDLYFDCIKERQPKGPYAIAGYSYGSMIAFELAKLLNKIGDEVKFLGAFNLPPHIKFRMRQLDWTNCLLHLSYFLGFFSEEYAHSVHPTLAKGAREKTIEHVLSVAPPARMVELGLDADKLVNWADLAYSLQSSATDYEPSGIVESIDVFCAVPLAAVAKDMDDWMENHLGKWKDFSRTPPAFHRVHGAHYTMISPENVFGFQKTLKAALAARGI